MKFVIVFTWLLFYNFYCISRKNRFFLEVNNVLSYWRKL
ncbi:hypothetical protein CHCC14821_2521 [Bacillus paralicheniformis]|nr:hypothetical protein CHCC19467_3568 [Bacillus paralicheniformis]TWM31354.1 hypothetical protein CHCC14821_2521 [Bacillus paralicheniformis]